jgi:hypothetical protein
VNLKPVQYCQAQVAAVSVHAFAGLSVGLTCQSRMGVTPVRLKVEQIQLLSVAGLFRCGLIAREGA